jgi:hypothetical protein
LPLDFRVRDMLKLIGYTEAMKNTANIIFVS